MTIKVQLSSAEEEAAFQAQAAAEGLSVPEWLKKLGRERAHLSDPQAPKKMRSRRSLAELLRESPLAGADLDLERSKDYPRPIQLR